MCVGMSTKELESECANDANGVLDHAQNESADIRMDDCEQAQEQTTE